MNPIMLSKSATLSDLEKRYDHFNSTNYRYSIFVSVYKIYINVQKLSLFI